MSLIYQNLNTLNIIKEGRNKLSFVKTLNFKGGLI